MITNDNRPRTARLTAIALPSVPMLHRMDQDLYWRFELFRRRCDPLDFRKWKRDSQRELKGLYSGRPRLLDSTAGLGDHTVNLAEVGFEVEACDRCDVALEATRGAVAAAQADVPVFQAEWANLARPQRYDLIFNDALHWTYDEAELRAGLAGFLDALKPGGALVFFFADARHPEPGHGIEILEWDWEHMERERIAWDHRDGDEQVTLSILCERGEDYIDEHHVYLARDIRSVELQTLTVRRVYRWDWHRLAALLEAVGYVDLRSDHFQNVKGHTFAMSRAFRPQG